MAVKWEIPAGFEYVSAAVVDALMFSLPYGVTLEPEHPHPRLTVCSLTWQEPGDVGQVVVRAVDQGRTEVRIEGPSPVYHVDHPGQDDVTEIATERQRLHDWCAEALTEWVRPWLEGIALPEKRQTGRPVAEATESHKAKRTFGPHGGTLDRVKEARELMEKGIPKTKACKRAGIDPRTYDRYLVYIIDWEEEEAEE